MGGYFICNGIERIIRMLILQRRHYIMALKRSAYLKRGSNYTDAATMIRCAQALRPLPLPPSRCHSTVIPPRRGVSAVRCGQMCVERRDACVGASEDTAHDILRWGSVDLLQLPNPVT